MWGSRLGWEDTTGEFSYHAREVVISGPLMCSTTVKAWKFAGKIRKVWFFAPGCLNNCTQGWSFSVILAWDNQKGTFLTHFFNFGHEGAPNVTKITYNMIIWWENSPRKKIGADSFTGGWAILFKKKKYGPFHWSCSSTYTLPNWGPTVQGPTVRGPNCPGPNCPGPNCPGPNCPGPNSPRTPEIDFVTWI